MRPRGTTRGTDPTNQLSAADPRSLCHFDLAHVATHGDQAATVVEDYGIAIEVKVARQRDQASRGCDDRRAFGSGDVKTRVRSPGFAVVEPTQSKLAGNPALHGL